MADTYIVNGRAYIGRRFEKKTLRLSGGRLQVLEADAAVPAGAEVLRRYHAINAAQALMTSTPTARWGWT